MQLPSKAQVMEPEVQEADVQYPAVKQILHCFLDNQYPDLTRVALCQNKLAAASISQ